MAAPTVKHVVVDSGPFIANAPLREIGEEFYTIRDVTKEIRDKATRQRLQVLPYTLKFKEPSPESIRIVTEFSKQTGDYASLSAVDLRVMALTYELEKEHRGTEHINTTPNREITFETTNSTLQNPTAVAGFYLPKPKTGPVKEGGVLPTSQLEPAEEEEEEDSDSEDDEDGCWITPDNVKAVIEAAGESERANVCVGCCTGDFAMQNVLIQMGLNVISYNGMLIKRAKSYVLRCHACFKITTNMMREFCHNCGNKTLQKVSMSVEEDGKIRYFLSSRKQMNTRGLKYSLPMPKGGKHAINPILCEDQKEAQHRASKASKLKFNALDEDYVAGNSPFAPIDVTSRAARLGIKSGGGGSQKTRRNPNASRGRRK